VKPLAVVFFAFALASCTPSQDEHAREQARKAGQELKHDAREIGHEAAVDTRNARREIDEGLRKADEKARRALNKPTAPDKAPYDKHQ
jgi:hypothetical protein